MSTSTKHKAVLTLLIIFFCLLSNMIQVLIDTPAMREHASSAVDMIYQQEASPTLIGGFNSTRLDNFTSCLIIKTAAYVGPESFWQKAFGGLRVDLPTSEDVDGWGAFCTYATGYESPSGGLSYSRYWHGYTLPLRLLLAITTFSNIQMLTYGIVLFLIIFIVLSFSRNSLSSLIPAFAIAVFIMVPSALGICIQYVPVTLICLFSCLVISCHYNSICQFPGVALFFCIIGLLTCYYDLLTFPIITLCMPLVILIQQMINHNNSHKLKHILFSTIAWCIGFFGFWMLKFVLNAFLFGSHNALNVLQQIQLRLSSSSNGVHFTRLDAFLSNIYVLAGKDFYRYLFIALIIFEAVRLYKQIKTKQLHINFEAFLFLIPVLIPVIWMFMTSNHIFDHYYYTYRNLAGTIFASSALLEELFFRSHLSPS